MTTLFTKIINGEIPCHKIYENERFFSFLDIRPISKGHTLVIPKIEVDVFFDLDNTHLSEILTFSKPISKAIENVVPCNRIGIMVAGLEVPHAHLHLVPITDISGLSFAHAKPAQNDQLAELAKQIKSQLDT